MELQGNQIRICLGHEWATIPIRNRQIITVKPRPQQQHAESNKSNDFFSINRTLLQHAAGVYGSLLCPKDYFTPDPVRHDTVRYGTIRRRGAFTRDAFPYALHCTAATRRSGSWTVCGSSSSVGEQLVTDRFVLDWRTWLGSSENQLIVTSVDGRGSTGRGERFLHAVHRRLGTVDVADQLDAARSPLNGRSHYARTRTYPRRHAPVRACPLWSSSQTAVTPFTRRMVARISVYIVWTAPLHSTSSITMRIRA